MELMQWGRRTWVDGKSKWCASCAIVLAGIYAVLASRFVAASIDDLWIIMRYAENVAHGHGYVFNLGERVEGFTCFGWVALLAGLVRLGWPAYWAAKFFGLLCGGMTMFLTYKIARELWRGRSNERLLAFMPVSLLVVNRGFLYWSVSGLETALFTCLVVATLYYLVLEARFAREQNASRWGATVAQGVLCLAANLVRPEGLALTAYVLAAKIVISDSRKTVAEQSVVFFLLCFVPLGAFFLWRYQYFGAWLPNTFDAKMGGALWERLTAGRSYLFGAMADNAFGWLGWNRQTAYPGLLLFYLVPTAGLLVVQRKRAHLILLGWLWLDTAATIWKGGDWMPYYRFLQPAAVLWGVLLTHVLVDAAARVGQWQSHPWSRKLTRGVSAASGIIVVALVIAYMKDNVSTPIERPFDRQDSWPMVFARYMLQQKPEGVLAASDIGLIGHQTGYRIIDMVGLVDRYIAQSPGNSFQKEYDPAYVLDQDPDFVILQGHRCLPEQRLEADPRFQESFRFVMQHGSHRLFALK